MQVSRQYLLHNIIAETLFDRDNEEINFSTNKVNMELWKKRLTTDVDELPEHNIWNLHIDKQKEICERYGSKWTPINNKLFVGTSENLTTDPIHGLRHPIDKETTKGTTGWFIWTGDYSEADDVSIVSSSLFGFSPGLTECYLPAGRLNFWFLTCSERAAPF